MTLISAGIIALLYVLGVQLGKGLRDSINIIMEQEGLEVDRMGSTMLTYLWPVGAAAALYQDIMNKEDEEE